MQRDTRSITVGRLRCEPGRHEQRKGDPEEGVRAVGHGAAVNTGARLVADDLGEAIIDDLDDELLTRLESCIQVLVAFLSHPLNLTRASAIKRDGHQRAWIEQGLLGGDMLNAADFQIAPNVIIALGGTPRVWHTDRVGDRRDVAGGAHHSGRCGAGQVLRHADRGLPRAQGAAKGRRRGRDQNLTRSWWRTAAVATLGEAQRGLDAWSVRVADQRTRSARTVGEIAAAEVLRALPPLAYSAQIMVQRKASRAALTAFEGNHYNVAGRPRTRAGRVTVTWRISEERRRHAPAHPGAAGIRTARQDPVRARYLADEIERRAIGRQQRTETKACMHSTIASSAATTAPFACTPLSQSTQAQCLHLVANAIIYWNVHVVVGVVGASVSRAQQRGEHLTPAGHQQRVMTKAALVVAGRTLLL